MRNLIRKFLQYFNYDIIKLNYAYAKGKLNMQVVEEELGWLKHENLATVIDIGANEGQFSEKIRAIVPDATIYSFEPLPHVFEILTDNFKDDAKFIGINKGVSNVKEAVEINLNESTASSSLLEMSDLHKANFDYAVSVQTVKIEVDTLDNLLWNYQLVKPLLIKIDVQGLEDKVIEGAKTILSKADILIVELTFEELYKNQPLFDKMYSIITNQGFYFSGIVEQLKSPVTGKVLQCDGVFRRKANV